MGMFRRGTRRLKKPMRCKMRDAPIFYRYLNFETEWLQQQAENKHKGDFIRYRVTVPSNDEDGLRRALVPPLTSTRPHSPLT